MDGGIIQLELRDRTVRLTTGEQIVAPKFSAQYQPDIVIVMSPIYLPEITAESRSTGVRRL